MAHHPKKTLEQHHLQIAVIFFCLILWFFPVPSGLDTFISRMPAGDLKFTSQTAWHLFAIFITVIFAVILNSMAIFTAQMLALFTVFLGVAVGAGVPAELMALMLLFATNFNAIITP